MLSKKKLTLSLTFLVMVLAIGLVMTPTFGHDTGGTFEVTFTPGELMDDVSTVDHDDVTDIQVESGRNRASVYPTAVPNGPIGTWYDINGTAVAGAYAAPGVDAVAGPVLSFSVDFATVVQLHDVTTDTVTPSGNALGLDDFTVDAYDDLFRSLGTLNLAHRTNADGEVSDTAANNIVPVALLKFKTPRVTEIKDPGELPGRQFTLTIHNYALQNAYNVATGGDFEIHYLLIQLAHAAADDASLATRQAQLLSDPTVKEADLFVAGHSNGPHFIRVDLVEKDEGDPKYSKIVSGSLEVAGDGDPGVVAISKVIDRSLVSAVETGPFDIRIMLTEEPAEFTADYIRVVNGSAADPVHLLPIPSPGTSGWGRRAIDVDGDFITISRELGLNYHPEKPPPGMNGTPAEEVADATGAAFPRATGRDNAYHLYSVTITPNPDVNGFVTVSVNNFDDQVLPTPNEFDALTPAELVADTPQLSDNVEAERSRRAVNGREVLEVRVQTAAATDIYAAAQAQLDANPRLKALGKGLIVPANGYLVLAADLAKSGIVDPKVKIADKKSVASEFYNTTALGLPFPADDLSNFFRNGGTLQLLHTDIPASTVAADADTGYAGATTSSAKVADSLVISEIMWGLNGDATTSQYIEIQNTTTADIGIDDREWVIAVGAVADSHYTTVVDTIGNSAGWEVPGSDGNAAATATNPTVIDLVSMSRVGDDGTAEASWAVSERPSANLSGRRVGTPGADNNATAVVVDDTVVEEVVTPTAAPAATAADIMISEVMVASNEGRLPQWIELANVSGAAVSLSGWSIAIENDAADDDVAGESFEIDLDGVEIGADQVALVVSKTGRNSGVGIGAGDLREDRILDVQDMVSPDNARYSLISEMGFMISLRAPQTTALVEKGDEAGNLGMGWEIPMSEGGRSSLIRREMGDAGEIMGTDAAGWVLASDTNLDGAYRTTYYGSDEDSGTPGFNAGGALPVELSGFGAKRDPLTGAAVITWSTQSELNNAGFFIKRSQQQNSRFVIVNPTMIAGAGTTAEKQSYTYTDATADPNIVYYYQIEDVSLDGNRQTLTRAHRLKGHIGAAGKATTTWGELKSSRD